MTTLGGWGSRFAAGLIAAATVASLAACVGDVPAKNETPDGGNSPDTGSDTGSADTGLPDSAGDTSVGTVNCSLKNAPQLFAPVAGTGPYCYQAATATANHCALGQVCCHDLTASPRTCSTTNCPSAVSSTACYGPTECTSGSICCGRGTPNTNTCSYPVVASYTGTVCATACKAGEYVTCASDADCGGKKCTPAYVLGGGNAYTLGMQVGYCPP